MTNLPTHPEHLDTGASFLKEPFDQLIPSYWANFVVLYPPLDTKTGEWMGNRIMIVRKGCEELVKLEDFWA